MINRSPMTDLLGALKENPFVLAPMAGITDLPFRSFMREMGCGVVISELVSATGLKYSGERTRRLMRFSEDQRPVGIQLFGESPEELGDAAKVVQEMGADFVDLNFGCPVPKVVKKGAGAALLKDPVAVGKVFQAVTSAVNIPVTVKIRTGWDDGTRNATEIAQIAESEGLAWVAIHGRTRAQAYTGQADWGYMAEVKSKSRIPIIGNGDITSPEIAVRRLRESNCDAVMIGRGCLKNPWIFLEAQQLWSGQKVTVEKTFVSMLDQLGELLDLHCEDRLAALQMKKLSAWFSSGFSGSSQFRKSIFQTQDKKEVYNLARDYFAGIAHELQTDTSSEPFLMGGHG